MKLPEIPKRIPKKNEKIDVKLLNKQPNNEAIDFSKDDLSRKSTLNSNNQHTGSIEEMFTATPLNKTNAKIPQQNQASPNNVLKSMIKKKIRDSRDITPIHKKVQFKDNLNNEKLVQVYPVESYKHFYLNDIVLEGDSCCCMIQ